MMYPKDAFEEINKRLRERVKKLHNIHLTHSGHETIKNTVRATLDRFIDEYDPALPVTLPCGHVYEAEDLEIEVSQDRDIVNISYICRECGKEGTKNEDA